MPAAGDLDVTSGPVRLRVEGLGKTLRALSAAGADAEDMRDLMHKLGLVVVEAARPRTPARSGALEGTIRAGRGKTKAVVRAGTARVPYAGVIHYGWPAHNIAPHPYLTDALDASRGEVLSDLDDGITQLLRDNHLI